MKKYRALGLILGAALMISSTCTAVFAADDMVPQGYEKVRDIMSITCSEATTLSGLASSQPASEGVSKPFNYNSNSGNSGLSIEDTGDEEHKEAIKLITCGSAVGTLREYITGWYSYTSAGTVIYEADFLFKDFVGSRRILEPVFVSANMKDGTAFQNKVYAFVVEKKGEGGVAMVGGARAELEANTWYTFTVAINMDAGLSTYYINGEQVAEQDFSGQYVTGKTPCVNRARIRAAFLKNQPEETEGFYIDNLRTTSYAKRPGIESAVYNGETEAVEVTVTQQLKEDTVNADNISLLLEGEKVETADVSYSGRLITITPKKPLITAMKYTVSISDSVLSAAGLSFDSGEASFETEAAGFDVVNVSVSQSGEITAEMLNVTEEDKSAVMIVAFKNSAGSIIGFGMSATTQIPDGSTTLSVPANVLDAVGCEVFFIDNWASKLCIKNYVYKLSLR